MPLTWDPLWWSMSEDEKKQNKKKDIKSCGTMRMVVSNVKDLF